MGPSYGMRHISESSRELLKDSKDVGNMMVLELQEDCFGSREEKFLERRKMIRDEEKQRKMNQSFSIQEIFRWFR